MFAREHGHAAPMEASQPTQAREAVYSRLVWTLLLFLALYELFFCVTCACVECGVEMLLKCEAVRGDELLQL